MPNAPSPVRDSFGNIVSPWSLRVGYDDGTDSIYVTFDTPAGPYTASQHLETRYGPEEIEVATRHALRLVQVAHARRLF